MAKKRKPIQLPKDAIDLVELGHSFAEYDPLLEDPQVFVKTPAMEAVLDRPRAKCIFVGRRGTGKTAITRYVLSKRKQQSHLITPQILSSAATPFPDQDLTDPHQRPFRSVSFAFKRALICEILHSWQASDLLPDYEVTGALKRHSSDIEESDFDLRLLGILEELEETVKKEKLWLRFLKRPKELVQNFKQLAASDTQPTQYLLVDRIDEDWDGSDHAVVMLMALMHACVEVTTEIPSVRALLFIRENIFERVRKLDNEFGRLETWVMSLEWTRSLLLELIERRLMKPFNTKTALHGETWAHFFEELDSQPAYDYIFDHCQQRPRDVLTYCEFAISIARSERHTKVSADDLLSAKSSFSDSRLKELGDEYAENYPQLHLVLARFFGLGNRFTTAGMTELIQALLADSLIKDQCSEWLFNHSSPERFIELLYSIGFIGIDNGKGVRFRSIGTRSAATPPIDAGSQVVVHPMYLDALQLRDKLVTSLEGLELRESGLLLDLPGGLDPQQYSRELDELADEIRTTPRGEADAAAFENVIGKMIQLCFFRVLSNPQPQERDVENRIRRDWIASIVAISGFWEKMGTRYKATQVVWECKNYDDLDASDFHQINYYLTPAIGRFGIIAFRGEVKNHYYGHVKRIANEKDGMVLMLGEKDLETFIRQAKSGKISKDTHIQALYDTTVRKVS